MVGIGDVVFKLNNKESRIDGLLAQVLDKGIKEVKKDNDLVILLVGGEGTGKSKFRDLIGGYCEYRTKNKFGINNIHFTTQDYMKFALKEKPLTVVSHDEARRDLNTKRSMSKVAVQFTNYLSECRDNNQIHIIILPAFSDIDKYIALWRVKLLIEVGKYKNKNTKEYDRGLFRVIKSRSKKKLAFYHKNKYSRFPKSMVAFTGRFYNNEIIDTIEYKAKKQKHKEIKYIDNVVEKNDVILTPRQIEVISLIKPSVNFKVDTNDYDILRKLVKSLKKAALRQSG